MEKVRHSESGCIEWSGVLNNCGYGCFTLDGKKWLAHRLVWTLHFGKIPARMVVMHECDNPACCNVDHLRIGTQAANNADRELKGRGKVPVRRRGRWTGALKSTAILALSVLLGGCGYGESVKTWATGVVVREHETDRMVCGTVLFYESVSVSCVLKSPPSAGGQ